MKFTTLIPKAYNDGTPVPPALLERLVEEMYSPIGGVSYEGEIRGVWTDQGVQYRDVSEKVSIVCDREQLNRMIRSVRKIGRRLKQKAMYIEVSGYDGVQILDMEGKEGLK